MSIDLLALPDLEPPMGDLCTHRRLDRGRAAWAGRLSTEADLPKKRIIHQRALELHGRARLHRLGLRRGPGYHKCGSRLDLDGIAAVRVLARVGGRWRELLRRERLPLLLPGETRWFRLPRITTDGVLVEVRRAAIDGGWTSWNLAMSGLQLEGELLDPIAPRRERRLTIGRMDLSPLPEGVRAERRDGEVRYRTNDFEVGFVLGRPGFSFLGLHTESRANRGRNLLAVRPPTFEQGTMLHPVGRAPVLTPSVRCDLEGTTSVRGNVVRYDFQAGGQRYRLVWTVAAGGLTLRAERTATTATEAWHSAAWMLGLRNSVTPSHVLARLREAGESGAVVLPALLVLPGFGNWEIRASGDGWARSDCNRQSDLNTLELKIGERATPEGLYRLPRGTHSARFTLRPRQPPSPLVPAAPAVAKRALARAQWTALTFRPDTATLSNSGASMHCPICMDTWAAVAAWQPPVLPGLPAMEFLRYSLERWLTGGPGYAAGQLLQDGTAHDADDEYLMTGASALRGLGDYLRLAASPAWYRAHRRLITGRIQAARARDLDGDGLVESPHRTGVSGTGQWSTCWFDVISFGWKDAFANAILHGALLSLADGLARLGDAAPADDLREWAAHLRRSYRPAFWNPATGWLAGWRCREDRLHDHAFLAVNGAAIAAGLLAPDESRAVLRRLLAEMKRVGVPDAALGLPGNLWAIPDEDLADIMQGYPLGYYQNGGRTHAQTRHLVMALYLCGLRREADALLKRLCVGLAEARVFGGNQSGVDWRYWDDRPCGYEGLLTDQFGVLEAIHHRWGRAAGG